MIDRAHALPITRQAKALGVARSTVYALPTPISGRDLDLMKRIDRLHLEMPYAGSRMLRDLLNQDGIKVGRKIERILMSLALKTTSQSVIVSKLSSHRRQNRTKQALWEFEHVIRSLYLLDYIDSPLLRRNVQRALNRGEAYHRLRRAIAYAHGGRFRVRSQPEQELWNECTRLVANAVVYYNSEILSELLATLGNGAGSGGLDWLAHVAPLAWQHVNFYGRYRFESDLQPIDLRAIATQLAQSNTKSRGLTA